MTLGDRQGLVDAWEYRYLTAAQIARRHFHSRTLAQRRLRRLAGAGLLHRFQVAEARRTGFQAWWYCLTRAGLLRRGPDGRALTRQRWEFVRGEVTLW